MPKNVYDIGPRIKERRRAEELKEHESLAREAVTECFESYVEAFSPAEDRDIIDQLQNLVIGYETHRTERPMPYDALETYVDGINPKSVINLDPKAIKKRNRFLNDYVAVKMKPLQQNELATRWICSDAVATLTLPYANEAKLWELSQPEKVLGWFAETDLINGRDEVRSKAHLPESEMLMVYRQIALDTRVISGLSFMFLDKQLDSMGIDKSYISGGAIVKGLRERCHEEFRQSVEDLAYVTPFGVEDLDPLFKSDISI